MGRLSIALLLAIPGIGLAMSAKPFVLGEGILLIGLLLAIVLPVSWLILSKA